MKFVLFCSALLGAFALNEAIKCKDLQKIQHDASKTLAPYGAKWMLAASNMPKTDMCINFRYEGKRDYQYNLATADFIDKRNASHLPMKVLVDNDMDQWTAQGDTGPAMKYRKLYIDYVNEWFCIYACDDALDKIAIFRCLTTNAQGWNQLNATLTQYMNNGSLPFKGNSWPVVNVWDPSICNVALNTTMPLTPLQLGPLNASLPSGINEIKDNEDVGFDDDDDDKSSKKKESKKEDSDDSDCWIFC